MTKSQLVQELVAKAPHVSQKEMGAVVDTIFDQMVHSLASGERIELRGFGTFEIRVRNPRMGRNPKSGASVSLSIRRVPFFKAGKELKEIINNKKG